MSGAIRSICQGAFFIPDLIREPRSESAARGEARRGTNPLIHQKSSPGGTRGEAANPAKSAGMVRKEADLGLKIFELKVFYPSAKRNP